MYALAFALGDASSVRNKTHKPPSSGSPYWAPEGTTPEEGRVGAWGPEEVTCGLLSSWAGDGTAVSWAKAQPSWGFAQASLEKSASTLPNIECHLVWSGPVQSVHCPVESPSLGWHQKSVDLSDFPTQASQQHRQLFQVHFQPLHQQSFSQPLLYIATHRSRAVPCLPPGPREDTWEVESHLSWIPLSLGLRMPATPLAYFTWLFWPPCSFSSSKDSEAFEDNHRKFNRGMHRLL